MATTTNVASDGRERTAVVTGGGSGIGKGIAQRLAHDGYRVVIVGRSKQKLEEAAAEIGSHAVVADLSQPAEVERAANDIVSFLGSIDVLVLCAGAPSSSADESLEDVEAQWLGCIRSNVLTAVLTERALRPHLTRPGGRIVSIGSITAFGGFGPVAYSASKAALHRWILNVADEVGPQGITANILAPGFVPNTGLYGGPVDPAFVEKVASKIAIRRAGTPGDIASGVAWLALPEASFINGSILTMDGGHAITL